MMSEQNYFLAPASPTKVINKADYEFFINNHVIRRHRIGGLQIPEHLSGADRKNKSLNTGDMEITE